MLERSRIASEASIIARGDLLIAQHRDKLRYAAIRGGSYVPMLREFQAGDFVYLKRRSLESVLQMAAKGPVYMVKDVHDNGIIILQGKCGATFLDNVVNCAPYHLPNIDPTIDVLLCCPENSLSCEACHFFDQGDSAALRCMQHWLAPGLLGSSPDCGLLRDIGSARAVYDGVTLHDVAEEKRRQRAAELANPSPEAGAASTFKDADARRRTMEAAALSRR